ncbi:hypothetical protein GCM10027431_32770 [Lysobacter rhizosphaerae]
MTTPEKAPTERLDTTAAAAYLGRSRSWLDKERASGRGPRYVMLGRRVFYRLPDLERYVENSVVETEDTRGAA